MAEAKPAKERSGLSLAVGDALATAFFVFVSSTFEEASSPALLVTPTVQHADNTLWTLHVCIAWAYR